MEERCPSCRALLEPALPLCVTCGRLFPEQEAQARALVIRQMPEDQRQSGEIRQLLAAASGQDEARIGRYLQRGPALFRLPASAAVAGRLRDHLMEAGAQVELEDAVSSESEWTAWASGLWREKQLLVLLWAGTGLAALGAVRSGRMFFIWLIVSGALALVDLRGFGRRISLSPGVLARRLGLVSGALARPAAALLRRARSASLREALGTVLVEHARLLASVGRALASHPGLQAPFRQTLDELGEHTLHIAENAAAIEEAGDGEGPDLPARLASLRALGSAETDRQLKDLLTSRDQRAARHQWLMQAHALLLVRLEAIAERLRGLRQETASRALMLTADPAAADRSLEALGRELELAASALHEVERGLPQALPEVIAEVIAPVVNPQPKARVPGE